MCEWLLGVNQLGQFSVIQQKGRGEGREGEGGC